MLDLANMLTDLAQIVLDPATWLLDPTHLAKTLLDLATFPLNISILLLDLAKLDTVSRQKLNYDKLTGTFYTVRLRAMPGWFRARTRSETGYKVTVLQP